MRTDWQWVDLSTEIFRYRNEGIRSFVFLVFEFWFLHLLKDDSERCDLLEVKDKMRLIIICVALSKEHSFGQVVFPQPSCC